jgi:hypothetical protein
MKKLPQITGLVLLLASFSCVFPSNPDYSLRVVNDDPEYGSVTLYANGESITVTDEYNVTYGMPTTVRIVAETLTGNPQHFFRQYTSTTNWGLFNGYEYFHEKDITFEVSDQKSDFTVYFGWEKNRDPLVLWDGSVLYEKSNLEGYSLKRWSHPDSPDEHLVEGDYFAVRSFENLNWALLDDVDELSILKEDFTVEKISDIRFDRGYFPESLVSALVAENSDNYKIYLIDQDGTLLGEKAFGDADTLVYTGDKAQGIFLQVYQDNLYYIDLSAGALTFEERFSVVPDLPYIPNEGGLAAVSHGLSPNGEHFLLSAGIGFSVDPDEEVYYQVIVSEGKTTHKLPQGNLFEYTSGDNLFPLVQDTVQWNDQGKVVFMDRSNQWHELSLTESGLVHSLTGSSYPLEPETAGIKKGSVILLTERDHQHPTEDWSIEVRKEQGASNLFKIWSNGAEQRLTGPE